MQWLRFKFRERTGFGVLDGEQVAVYEGDMFGACAPTGETIAAGEIEWLIPCVPGKMIGLWNNYRAAAEKNGWAIPAEPLWFLKARNAYAAHRANVVPPRSAVGRIIFEGELAVVIGRAGKDIPLEKADQHIFGYSCANDVTAMELIGADGSFPQWCRAKSFDTFGVLGPVIATGLDPSQLVVRTTMKGREFQNYPVADALFSPQQLVSLLSRDMTLEPGDTILCGTSLGVMPWRPGVQVEVSIDGIGTLSNTMAQAES